MCIRTCVIVSVVIDDCVGVGLAHQLAGVCRGEWNAIEQCWCSVLMTGVCVCALWCCYCSRLKVQ